MGQGHAVSQGSQHSAEGPQPFLTNQFQFNLAWCANFVGSGGVALHQLTVLWRFGGLCRSYVLLCWGGKLARSDSWRAV